MAVIFAIGGVVVGGAVMAASYSDYSDYHDSYYDYSDYSNYSDYSDAAERRRQRISAKQSEINSAERDLNTFKTQTIEPLFNNKNNISINMSTSELDNKYKSEIKLQENNEISQETMQIKFEIYNINEVINKLKEVKKELGE